MSRVIGIDLGSCSSAVAHLDDSGKPIVLRNRNGTERTPSTVAIVGPNQAQIGHEAGKKLHPDQSILARFTHGLGTETIYPTGYGEYTSAQLSALLIRKLKNDAESALGPVSEAVVAVPANFSNEAREATLAATRAAGLAANFIINQTTAAAICLAFQRSTDGEATQAICDFGAGSFEVAIVKTSRSSVRVLSAVGLSRLGGDELDQKLAEIVRDKYREATGAEIGEGGYTRSEAESDKKLLSSRSQILSRVIGTAGRANVLIERIEFEEAIGEYLTQTEMLCELALLESNLKRSDIDEVVLVGGCARIPRIRERVARVFGREPTDSHQLTEAVALGAALYAASKTDSGSLNSAQITAVSSLKINEIANMCIGTFMLEENRIQGPQKRINSPMVSRGIPLPVSRTESFYLTEANRWTIRCSLTESVGSETNSAFVRVMWEEELVLGEGQPLYEVRATFGYDANQVIRCSLLDVGGNIVRDWKHLDVRKSFEDKFAAISNFVIE